MAIIGDGLKVVPVRLIRADHFSSDADSDAAGARHVRLSIVVDARDLEAALPVGVPRLCRPAAIVFDPPPWLASGVIPTSGVSPPGPERIVCRDGPAVGETWIIADARTAVLMTPVGAVAYEDTGRRTPHGERIFAAASIAADLAHGPPGPPARPAAGYRYFGLF